MRFFLIALTVSIFDMAAQRPASPLDFPLQLSGSYCDLRANHFHAGIDLRTQGTEGHAVHAILDGYISKITVSPWGYGNAVYICHPNDSLMTVYGHLQRFIPPIAGMVKERQYEDESFAVSLEFAQGELPVRQGDIFAYSGNTGSSGGPHLHLEMRDLRNNDVLDPLVWYKTRIIDSRKPELLGLMLYPLEGKGVINGKQAPVKIDLEAPQAWGETCVGIRAVDRMDGTNFSYGVKYISLTVDSLEIFRFSADRFSFAESYCINSHIDYSKYLESREFYLKTFVEPTVNPRFISARNSGIINIKEERDYSVKLFLSDIYGNTLQKSFKIRGKKQPLAPVDTVGAHLLKYFSAHTYSDSAMSVFFPENSLYNSILLKPSQKDSTAFFSAIHQLNDRTLPLRKEARLSVRVNRNVSAVDVQQLGIVSISRISGRRAWLGGKYNNGLIEANISETGIYAVSIDSIAPKIQPVEKEKWKSSRQITIRITDNFSGIATFRGEIDGKYALFEYEPKKSLITYRFDEEKLTPGYHRLRLTVSDRCGNSTEYNYSFTY